MGHQTKKLLCHKIYDDNNKKTVHIIKETFSQHSSEKEIFSSIYKVLGDLARKKTLSKNEKR